MSDRENPDNPAYQNPFDRLGLDPSLSPAQLTERLQRMAERLTPEKRDEVRAIWRELTIKDSERIKLAFFAHPGSSESIDALRRKIPPTRAGAALKDDANFAATVFDALLEFGDSNNPGGLKIDAKLQPDSSFMSIKAEGLATDTTS